MRTIPLIARRAFTYHGRTVQPGELIQASAIEAVSLRYRGQARFAPPAVVPAKPPIVASAETAPVKAPPPEPPEPVADAPEPVPEAEEPSEPSPDESADQELDVPVRRKRSYKRRDLEAEA